MSGGVNLVYSIGIYTGLYGDDIRITMGARREGRMAKKMATIGLK